MVQQENYGRLSAGGDAFSVFGLLRTNPNSQKRSVAISSRPAARFAESLAVAHPGVDAYEAHQSSAARSLCSFVSRAATGISRQVERRRASARIDAAHATSP